VRKTKTERGLFVLTSEKGAIAGIVIGVLVGVALLVVLAIFLLKKLDFDSKRQLFSRTKIHAAESSVPMVRFQLYCLWLSLFSRSFVVMRLSAHFLRSRIKREKERLKKKDNFLSHGRELFVVAVVLLLLHGFALGRSVFLVDGCNKRSSQRVHRLTCCVKKQKTLFFFSQFWRLRDHQTRRDKTDRRASATPRRFSKAGTKHQNRKKKKKKKKQLVLPETAAANALSWCWETTETTTPHNRYD
jgi:hypothetical protein